MMTQVEIYATWVPSNIWEVKKRVKKPKDRRKMQKNKSNEYQKQPWLTLHDCLALNCHIFSSQKPDSKSN